MHRKLREVRADPRQTSKELQVSLRSVSVRVYSMIRKTKKVPMGNKEPLLNKRNMKAHLTFGKNTP